jgi:SNF2 family DNA or RNA helicase
MALAAYAPPAPGQRLYPFQRDGVRALVESDALLLADDMGLGKTIQTVAALRVLFRLRRIESALLVVPTSVVVQWRRALRQWAPELRTMTIRGRPDDRAHQWRADVDVFLTTFDTLRSDFTENPQSPPRRRVWGVIVLDEAQRIKNRDTAIAHICKRLPRERAWALTGTPLENAADDLASICEFLGSWRDGEPRLRLTPSLDLYERHRTLQLRRKKHDVLTQLPPKTESEVMLDLGTDQQRAYNRAERDGIVELRQLGQKITITHILQLITRLKQICNICPETGQSVKLDDVEERLDVLTTEGHRALLFSQFVEEPFGVRAIARRLTRFDPLEYTGGLTTAAREHVLRQFRTDPRHAVLLLSLRAGGQGLNLQEASYVFHFDRWWNPAIERQAEDRSHRLGQTVAVTVYRYLCAGTIEQRIDDILRAKQALFDELIDDVSLDLRRVLTREEIFALFDLKPPRPANRAGTNLRHSSESAEQSAASNAEE